MQTKNGKRFIEVDSHLSWTRRDISEAISASQNNSSIQEEISNIRPLCRERLGIELLKKFVPKAENLHDLIKMFMFLGWDTEQLEKLYVRLHQLGLLTTKEKHIRSTPALLHRVLERDSA